MNYKILKVFDINYPQIIINFEKKKNFSNLDYYSHLNKFLNGYYIETPGFSKKMNLLGNSSNDIVYNYYNLQIKWLNENGFNLKDNLNHEEKLFYIFEKQISYFKPEIIFFRGQPTFDSRKLSDLKEKFKFIKKVICHNGFPSKNLKNVDLIFSSSPGLNQLYQHEGLRSILLYHSFDEEILSRVTNKNQIVDLAFFGQTGDTESIAYKRRFDYLNSLLSDKFPINCHSTEFYKKSNYILNKNFKEIFRNYLIKFFDGRIPSNFKNLDSIKNVKIKNFIKDLKSYTNRKKYLHDLWPKKIYKPLYGIDMYNELFNSNLTLNIHTDVSNTFCGNYRMFEATGLKSCLITENRQNIKDLFEPDFEVVTYKSLDELKDKLKNLLSDKKLSKKISLEGQRKTLKHHTLNKRIEFIDGEINKIFK